MDLMWERVEHDAFGEGVITQQDSSYVFVKFLTEAAAKKFKYPSCFKTFLKLLDANKAIQIDAIVKQQE